MEISKRVKDQNTELFIEGRLDAYWADHLAKEIDRLVREGIHRIILDLSNLEYISSAGVRVLVQYNKILSEMNGLFSISRISDAVKKVLDLIGLSDVLLKTDIITAGEKGTTGLRQYEKFGTIFNVYPQDFAEPKPMECRLMGHPQLTNGVQYGEKDCQLVVMPPSWYGIGLGCLGKNFADCQNRFGEFIVTAGTTAYLPTDGTNVPDFMTASGTFIPELCLLYGLFFHGHLSRFIRFDVQTGSHSICLSHLCEEILEILNTRRAAVSMVVETGGLVGSFLRASPANTKNSQISFKYPHIRKWLSFTSERAYQQNIALITGVVDKTPQEILRPFIRPLSEKKSLYGHFHAAVFPYRPIKIGQLDVLQTVTHLYETDNLQSVLHLINDDREFSGAGESEFLRGACWVSEISTFINN